MKQRFWFVSSLLLTAPAVIACEGSTAPITESAGISLSTDLLTLSPGTTEQVTVTVPRRTSAVRLGVVNLPQGLSATFSRDVIPAGDTSSALLLFASSAMAATEVNLAVTAAPAGSSGAIQSSTSLVVRVSCPGYAIPTNCPPFPTGGNQSISGVVYELSSTGRRPVPGARVWAWVERPTNGYSAGSVTADASGRYTFPNLPEAIVTLQAGGNGFDQPCGSAVTLGASNATVDIELVSEKAPIFNPDPSQPAIVGTVYETVAGERKPVSGARVFVQAWYDTVLATTVTDELGRYSLCRLAPSGPFLFVTPVKSGFTIAGQNVSVSDLTRLDLEMKRQ